MKDIYIGFVADIRRRSNIPKDAWIVTRSEQIEGLHGQVTIYLVGNYEKLPEWSAMKESLKRIYSNINVIKIN